MPRRAYMHIAFGEIELIQESEVFKALADETRIRVLNLFLFSEQALCVCEIVDALKVPQYNISKHLTLLKHAGLVDVEKEGLWGYYRLKKNGPKNRALLAFLRGYLTGEALETDRRNLEVRLLLREEGKCVVGFVSEQDLLKLIKEKSVGAP
jgi:ArsR family transcriptional regulator